MKERKTNSFAYYCVLIIFWLFPRQAPGGSSSSLSSTSSSTHLTLNGVVPLLHACLAAPLDSFGQQAASKELVKLVFAACGAARLANPAQPAWVSTLDDAAPLAAELEGCLLAERLELPAHAAALVALKQLVRFGCPVRVR